jgi:hypothetical protein
MEFIKFNKIPRLNRDIVITEKIDGTNSQIFIDYLVLADSDTEPIATVGDFGLWAGSRNRYLTLDNDNYGFAKWVKSNAEELIQLGPGLHFGEWWGQGLQRNYGLKEKRFSLFNVHKWEENRPDCCDVVPVLFKGMFSECVITEALNRLDRDGSYAAIDFMNPEGIVIFHTAGNYLFKVTCKNDEKHKEEL